MVISVIGNTGQLGNEIVNEINNIKKTSRENISIYENKIDIVDYDSLLKYVININADIIINCAAYTNVNQAEQEYNKSYQVNALGPKNLALVSEAIGAKLIHISTDYVFDGTKTSPYTENDTPNPINAYGKTKLLGEQYVEQYCSKYFIIRTSWLYGQKGNNFVKTIIKNAKEKGKLQVVNDQYGNPTNAEDLSRNILKLAFTNNYGIYHCTGKGTTTWYDFACKIIEYTGIKCDIEPVTSQQFSTNVRRPMYSSLDNMKLNNIIGDNMRSWEEALYDFIKNRLKI